MKHQHASVILNWETPKHQQKSAKQWGFSICTDGGNPMNIFHFGIFRITKLAVRKSMLSDETMFWKLIENKIRTGASETHQGGPAKKPHENIHSSGLGKSLKA